MSVATPGSDNDVVDEQRAREEYVGEKNTAMIMAHSNRTRELLLENDDKVRHLTNMVVTQNQTIQNLQQQLAASQGRLMVLENRLSALETPGG